MMCEDALGNRSLGYREQKGRFIQYRHEIRPTRWSGIQDIETLIVYSPEHLTKYSTNAAFMPGVDRSKSPDAVTTKRKWGPSRIRTFIPD